MAKIEGWVAKLEGRLATASKRVWWLSQRDGGWLSWRDG